MVTTISKKSWLFKVSLLSISLLTASAPAVAATIPAMAQSLKGVSLTSVEIVSSIPNLGLLIFVFLSPWIVKLLGEKKTVLTGVLITLLAGITPVFTDNFMVILISRFILGCGIGMFNSLAYSLISIFYEGNERATMLGFQAATGQIGTSILEFIVGLLLVHGWHITYWVYAISILPLILFGLFVPERSTSNQQTNQMKVSLAAIFYAIFSFFVYAAYLTSSYKLATLIIEKGYGTASQASYVLSIGTLLGFISGLFFGKVIKIFGKAIIPCILIAFAILFAGICYSRQLVLTGVLYAIVAAILSWLQAATMNEAAAYSDAASQTMTSSLILVGINLGVFVNPTVNRIIGGWISDYSAQASFLIASALFIVALILYWIFVRVLRAKQSN